MGRPQILGKAYPKGGEWVSALPRQATEQEIIDIVGKALAVWPVYRVGP